jgi:hypothetical protein
VPPSAILAPYNFNNILGRRIFYFPNYAWCTKGIVALQLFGLLQ